MAVYDLWASRKPINNINNYTGRSGRLFFDDANGILRLSDGVTPGGFPIPITLATETVAGGVKLGPGVTLNSLDQIIIDSSGLDFNFGDFEALVGVYPETHPKEGEDYALLSSANNNQDIVIASNDEGSIKVVGEFEIYAPKNGPNVSLLEQPVFRVQNDGQVKIRVPTTDPLEGAVEIVGSDTGATLSPAVEGVMLHITGNRGAFAASIYVDGIGGSGSFVGRRYNNCCEDPTPVLNGQTITRWAASGYSTTGFPSLGPAAVQIDAIEDFVGTSTGTQIKFFTAALGTNNRVAVATIDNQAGVTATKFTGPLTGNVTGNVTGNAGTVTNGVYTTDTATVTNTMLAGSIANNKLANSSITVNGTSIALGASGTVTAAAGTLTGTELNSTVVTSSLTSVGTLTNLTVTNTIVGSINGNAATATTATDLTAATGILAGTVSVNPPQINRLTTNTQTATVTGLTTNHKVIVTSATSMEAGIVVTAAWASAANTLSIEFSNCAFNQDIDPGAKDIQYFAWV
jgi:hypothetical protein